MEYLARGWLIASRTPSPTLCMRAELVEDFQLGFEWFSLDLLSQNWRCFARRHGGNHQCGVSAALPKRGRVFTCEMVTSRGLVERDRKTLSMLQFDPGERVRSVQLYGVDPAIMAQATDILCNEYGVDHVDLNFGCPTPPPPGATGGLRSSDRHVNAVLVAENVGGLRHDRRIDAVQLDGSDSAPGSNCNIDNVLRSRSTSPREVIISQT